MNERTRELVLLVGIMSILIGGVVVVTSVNLNTQENNQDNKEDRESNIKNDSANKPGINESKDTSKTENSSNDASIIEQSINGWKGLWSDVETGWEAILNQSSSNN